jgi:hypothetical protein
MIIKPLLSVVETCSNTSKLILFLQTVFYLMVCSAFLILLYLWIRAGGLVISFFDTFKYSILLFILLMRKFLKFKASVI